MSYFEQFKRFDPLLDDVPDHPFSILPQISQRARELLKSRTTEQIDLAAKAIDFAIYTHFDELKQNEIARLLHQAEETGEFERFFEWDGGSAANGRWLFKESMEEALDIPTAENTSEVDALKVCIEYLDDIDRVGFPNSQPFELFAVLSLWMLADTIYWIDFQNTSELIKFRDALLENAYKEVERLGFKMDKRSNDYTTAGDYALKAMDAVCYAEHLQAEGLWKSKHKSALEQQEQEERNRRSMQIKAAAIARHQKNNEAKAMATDEWAKDTSKFPSAEKAGHHFANWLSTKGFEFEPRTVIFWIRSHAKKIGVRFR